MKKRNLIKITYFDENSAMDFINIMDGGKNEIVIEKENESKNKASLSIGAKIAANLKFLNFFDTGTNFESNAELVSQSKDIVKATITNTILTDFIEKASKSDDRIRVFDKVKITIAKDSFTHLKIYTPYTYIVSEQSEINKDIAVSKLDSAMEKIKGYYEFLIEDKEKKYIFRFNIDCLRNNYKLTDLLKMDLTFFAVKVGQINESQLNATQEININTDEMSAEKIATDILEKDSIEEQNSELREIYDVILAGVEYRNEK